MRRDASTGAARSLAALVLAFALAGLACGPGAAPRLDPDAPREQARRHVNLGVAYLAQFLPGKAITEFEAALEQDPNNMAALVDLGIAYRVASDLDASRLWLQKALALDPDNIAAHFNMALVERLAGQPEAALSHLEQVLSRDPDDAAARYNLGLALSQLRRHEEALACFDAVIAQQPWHASAHYARGRELLQLGREDEAMEALQKSQEMSDGQMATTVGQQYGEQGRYSLALEDMPAEATADEAVAVSFKLEAGAAGIDAVHGGGPGSGPRAPGSGLALLDVDGDGDLDLFMADAGAEAGRDRLYLNDGAGRFAEAPLPAPASAAPSTGVAVGDYDNDGHPDIAVGRWGPDRLLRNLGDGTFEEVAAAAGTDHPGATLGMAFGDPDHDGDLDLLLADRDAGLVDLRNAGDGTFAGRGEASGLSGGDAATGLLFLDLDGDRDVDLLAAGPQGLRVLLNRRDGSFGPAPAGWMPAVPGSRSLAAMDADKDGWFDIVVAGVSPAALLANSGRGLQPAPALDPATAEGYGLALLDYDLDGFEDLVLASAAGPPIRLWRGLGAGRFSDVTADTGLDRLAPAPVRSLLAGDLDGDGDPDLVAGVLGGPLMMLRNEAPARPWVAVDLDGLHSNRSGLGSRVAVRAGALWQQAWLAGSGGYLGASPTRAEFGLGPWPRADAVSILWPGGVIQDEIDPPVGTVTPVQELDRKGSSCPTLFGWDGQRFAFLSDFIGGGVLGLWLAPGVVYSPDPDELHLVRSEVGLRPTAEGMYELRLTDNLEEVTYIDAMGLTVVDHPEGSLALPREGLRPMPPYPEADLILARSLVAAARAVDGEGADWTEALSAVDRTYPTFPLQRRLGYAGMHELTVTFPSIPEGERVWLWAHGTLEFSNSTPNFATSQFGGGLSWPSLEAAGADGRFVTLEPAMPIPMGVDKPAMVELTGRLAPGPVTLRIRTSMEIYWDRLALLGAQEHPGDDMRVTRLAPDRAELKPFGFPLWASEDGRLPRTFVYEKARLLDTWKPIPGRYTRFGPVESLVSRVDDRLVVMAAGDELAVSFDAGRLPPLPAGWVRTLLVSGSGWVKDTDLHTPTSGQVAPLPFRGMGPFPPPASAYADDPERAAAEAEFNTRVVVGRDPLRRWPSGSAVAPAESSD